MNRYASYKRTCEHCNQTFQAGRNDAKFCSPKCRTAQHRLDTKRTTALKEMREKLDATIIQMYESITPSKDGRNRIIDICVKHGIVAVEQTILVAWDIHLELGLKHDYRIKQKESTINSLHMYREMVNDVEKALNKPRKELGRR